MMRKVCVDDMINEKISNYPLVVAVAKRAREITDDIIMNSKIVEEKPVKLAYEEIKNHKCDIFEPDDR